MRAKQFKKVLAILLSLAMVMGMNTMAFATDHQITDLPVEAPSANQLVSGNAETTVAQGKTWGEGNLEGYVRLDVFKVTVPWSSQSNNHLRFVMDPQRLISKTDGARYAEISGNEVDKDATLLFMSMNKAAGKFTNISNPLSINNLSSVSVNVNLRAELVSHNGIILSDNRAGFVESDKRPMLWMSISVNKGNTVSGNANSTSSVMTKVFSKALSTNVVSDNVLNKLPIEDQTAKPGVLGYSISWNWAEAEAERAGSTSYNHGYYYKLNPDYVEGSEPDTSLTFTFMGDANQYGDWDAVNQATQGYTKLDVIWDVRSVDYEEEGDTDITVNSTTVAQPVKVKTVGIASDATPTNFEYKLNNTGDYANWDTSQISSFSGGEVTFIANTFSWVTEQAGRTCGYRVTFSDGNTWEFVVHQ